MTVTNKAASFVISPEVDGRHDDGRDRELFRRLAGGDRAALGELYDRHARPLFRHAHALTRQTADAEDLLQTTFVKLATTGASLLGVRRPAPYLHRILRATWIDLARHRTAAREQSIDDVLSAPGTVSADYAIDISRALANLPEPQREVVVLHLFNGFSFKEIGRITRVSTFTAGSRYRLALDRLRLLLGGQ